MPKLTVIAKRDASAWAQTINQSLQAGISSAVENWINAGLHLIDAKEGLKGQKGEWERMFAGNEHAVKHPIPLSICTAERLMKITKNPQITKSAHAPILPPSWYTLYELTKIPDEIFRKALSDGRIRPDMERKDVRALMAGNGHRASKRRVPLDMVEDAVNAIEISMQRILDRLSSEDQRSVLGLIASHVQNLLRSLEEAQ